MKMVGDTTLEQKSFADLGGEKRLVKCGLDLKLPDWRHDSCCVVLRLRDARLARVMSVLGLEGSSVSGAGCGIFSLVSHLYISTTTPLKFSLLPRVLSDINPHINISSLPIWRSSNSNPDIPSGQW